MFRGKRFPPPRRIATSQQPSGILELERFSDADFSRWKEVSKDLDELHASMYFGVIPEQRRNREDLIATLQRQPGVPLSVPRWVRIVTYQYSGEPLSAAGSLHSIGGRFNAGADLDGDSLNPWPALYIAADRETAYREKFQLHSSAMVEGLSPQELALTPWVSYATLGLTVELRNLFDMTTPEKLAPVAKVFGRIKMPAMAKLLMKKLRMGSSEIKMVNTGKQLYDAVFTHNWRMQPIQFGLPAPSHMLAELVRAAEFEGILYNSTKGSGQCLAVFPISCNQDHSSSSPTRRPVP